MLLGAHLAGLAFSNAPSPACMRWPIRSEAYTICRMA